METIETSRLLLRAWHRKDAEAMNAYARDPRVGPMAGWKPHETLRETRAILSSFIQQDETWAMVLRESGQIVGSIGLHPDAFRPGVHALMLGYVLAPEHWGKGLMTEAAQPVVRFAFEEKSVELLSCYHFPGNARSQRVIEKCGFTYEGLLRHSYRNYNGQVCDQACYSILRDDYRLKIKPVQAGENTIDES